MYADSKLSEMQLAAHYSQKRCVAVLSTEKATLGKSIFKGWLVVVRNVVLILSQALAWPTLAAVNLAASHTPTKVALAYWCSAHFARV